MNVARHRRLTAVALTVTFCSAWADDWPQWRGLERNSFSREIISTNWPATGPRVLWRADIGTGFSTVSVSQGRAYVMGNSTNQDTVWCFAADTGKVVWQHTYPAVLAPIYYEGGPGATPTVHEGKVFTISKWGDVFCFDAARGNVVWQRNLRQEGLRTNRWGFAGSPLVYGDLVIFNAGSAGLALNRHTGKTVWLTGTNATGYASPTLYRFQGKERVLIFAAKHLVALDPLTGEERWRFPWETGYDTNITDPLMHEGQIFVSSYSRGCSLWSVDGDRPEVVYDKKTLFNHLSPGILIGDYLYAFSGEAHKPTDFRCLHLPTGKVKWTRKDPAFGSMICARGRLVILSEKGELLVADPSPEVLKVLARAQVLGGVCWTPPTLANGRVYAHNAAGDMVCLDVAGAK
jgi:outer membrane protein assembly factor BamB